MSVKCITQRPHTHTQSTHSVGVDVDVVQVGQVQSCEYIWERGPLSIIFAIGCQQVVACGPMLRRINGSVPSSVESSVRSPTAEESIRKHYSNSSGLSSAVDPVTHKGEYIVLHG